MNQYGTNRFMPRKNLKIEKDLFNLFLGILTIFCSKRGTKRFTAGEISSARQRQFSAANRFMPRFERFLELIIILGWTFWITCKNKRIGVNSKPKPKHNYHLFLVKTSIDNLKLTNCVQKFFQTLNFCERESQVFLDGY